VTWFKRLAVSPQCGLPAGAAFEIPQRDLWNAVSCNLRQVFDCGNFVESGFSHGPRIELPEGRRMYVRAVFLGCGCTNGKPSGKVGEAGFQL
jgi:hypothetical protein